MASMSEPLLSIRNHHAPACGDPPIVNSDDPNVYIGYFENEHGEQWIFTCDRTTRRVELRGGDAGWTKTYAVTQAGVEAPHDLILSRTEQRWFSACLRAATGLTAMPDS
jgi:hypothetical protein